MGGGGVVRAAAKVIGIGAVNSGLRGLPSGPAGGPLLPQGPRGASRPVSATISSSSAQIEPSETTAQRPTWEVDDWEFAGGEGELLSEADYPLPRLVFGSVPTLEEAKSATADLQVALEKSVAPFIMGHESAIPLASNSSDSKTCITITSNTPVVPAPNQAVQAFKLLKENSTAQTVVASIASDPNVWGAVMQNEALTEFLHSHKSNGPPYDNDPSEVESVADNGGRIDEKQKEKEAGGRFSVFFENLKKSFVEMVEKASDFLRGEHKQPEDANPSTKESFAQSPLASLMVLAVTVILVVVLKRG